MILRGHARFGDDRVYDQYIQAYRPMVYSVCRRYLRNPEDVEDAVQETFIKMARHLHQVHGSIVAWLTSTAYSSSVDLICRAASEQRRRRQMARENPAGEQNALVGESGRQNIRQALLLLDETDRQLLIQRFFRRMPLRVIAEEAWCRSPRSAAGWCEPLRHWGRYSAIWVLTASTI